MIANTYHRRSKTTLKVSTIAAVLFFLFLITGSLNNVNSVFGIAGMLSLVLILGLSNTFLIQHLSKTKSIKKPHARILLIAMAFLLILVVGLLNNPTTRGIVAIAQFTAVIGFTIFSSLIIWNGIRFRVVGRIASLFIVFHFIIWASQGFKPLFSSIFINSNIMGPYMLYSLFFLICAKIHSKHKAFYNIMILLCISLLYASGARSALLAAVIGLFTYFIWKLISKRKFLFSTYLLTVYIFLISFPYLYPRLPYWKHFYFFDNLAWEYTGKRLMSGRHVIWEPLTSMIENKALLGYGTGFQASSLLGLSHSIHNFYLNTAVQNGFIGLLVFMALLFAIWLIFWKGRKDKVVRLSASFFIATLIYQSFEISLTQNQLSVGLIMWFVFSIGLSRSINTKQSTHPEN